MGFIWQQSGPALNEKHKGCLQFCFYSSPTQNENVLQGLKAPCCEAIFNQLNKVSLG